MTFLFCGTALGFRITFMEEPTIAGRTPIILDVNAGDHWWCACGRSATPPFCDGSHKGTQMGPVKVTIGETKRVAFCNCKHSKNPPYCDGSHADLPA